MYVCDNCGKGIMRGNAVSHAKNRSKRIFLPNLHTVKALVNGQPKIIRVCTKCLRKVIKAPKRGDIMPPAAAPSPLVQKEEIKKHRGRPKKVASS